MHVAGHPTPASEELDHAACVALLAAHTFARLAYIADGYPVTTPVNYGYAAETIVIRTDAGERADHAPSSLVSFEIQGCVHAVEGGEHGILDRR